MKTKLPSVIKTSLFIIVLALGQIVANATVKLPALVGDGMVLQRAVPIPVWGWASPGEKITVTFNKKEYKTTCGTNGEWSLKLKPQKAGGPFTMEIQGENQIRINDILVGDVWICSGQSNMGMTMAGVQATYPEDITSANYPNIRQFYVGKGVGFSPLVNVAEGKWISASPATVQGFGAVGYYFARDLYNKYKVPIGLINTSWGGTRIETWISEEGLKEFPVIDAQRKDLDGKLWLRKEISLPWPIKEESVSIEIAYNKNMDKLFFNGKLIGKIDSTISLNKFKVPTSLVKEKNNLLALSVVDIHKIDWTGTGVVYGKEVLTVKVGNDTIKPQGDRFYQAALHSDTDPFPYARRRFFQDEPATLYNAIVAPLVPTAIKGVIWYQGESNVKRANEYRKLFPAMIRDWRDHWGQGDFPFLYVQLANFYDPVTEPGKSTWAELREAQRMALSVYKTGMAVIHDLGEAKDIHPKNKRDVGIRLALAAQKVAYGDNKIVYSGPEYQSLHVDGNKITISFNHTGTGLVARGGSILKHFAIAGADKKFVWAEARIENNEIVVWNDKIPFPVAVRYAWADNPEGCNLYNMEGLPASSFRTDDWD